MSAEKRKSKKRGEQHVRLYAHELQSEAYRSLSTEARSLLVEMRSLYTGRENRVFISRTEMQRRLGVGQHRANKARDELIDRGFIKVLKPGSFTQKVRHATEYALLNEPLEGESVVRKDYMSWPSKKRGVDNQPRWGRSPTPVNGKRPPNHPSRDRSPTPSGHIRGVHGVDDQPTDRLPRVGG